MIRHFNENTAGRDFVVGDIHGCTAYFHILLHRIGFDESVDRMFSVGDLIDRGPDSEGALTLLNEPWFHAVRGNHEDILLQVTEQGADWNWWVRNGGAWAQGRIKEELAEYAASIKALPFAITVGEGADRFNVVHAEFFGSDADLDAGNFCEHQQETLMWGRSLISGYGEQHQAGLSATYCGHTIVKEIQRRGKQIYIDTGAFVSHFWEGVSENAMTIIEPKTGQSWRSTEAI